MKNLKNTYKELYDFDKRIIQSMNVASKHHGKIPVILIVDPAIKSTNDRYYKYLVSGELCGSYIINSIRRKIKIPSNMGIFCLTEKNNTLMCGTTTFAEIYKLNKDEDGFLYLNILIENTFGN